MEAGPLLALVTSGAWTSIALLTRGAKGLESESLAEPAGAEQSRRLLAMIGELLGDRPLDTLGAIAFDEGPGAFTGLRIGCAVAQGLGFASGLPLVPVGSLEAAAWRALRAAEAPEAVVLVANDARMGELYVSVCVVRAPDRPGDGPSVRTLVEPRVVPLRAPSRDLSCPSIETRYPELAGRRWLVAGDAWRGVGLDDDWLALARPAGEPGQEGAGRSDPERAGQAGPDVGLEAAGPADARSVAELAWTLWQDGGALAAEDAAPRYVRDKVALDVDEQRRLREGRLAPGSTRELA
ncbi:MAG: tRNA (adenosine(37)-N6)-threonylcarbamoyltransferase complex dimerization subunit type 1 TsaB [Gammaproteobacteria bacterium]